MIKYDDLQVKIILKKIVKKEYKEDLLMFILLIKEIVSYKILQYNQQQHLQI